MIGSREGSQQTPGRAAEPAATRVARPGVSAWLMAIRPATLPAAAAGVVVGLGAARSGGAPFRADTALECLIVALLMQVLANLANDLSDFRRGADTADRLGPTRVAASGLISTRGLEAAIALAIAAIGVDGLLLVAAGGPAVLALGVAAVLAALAYTGGPWPYGYRGLGEPLVFAFFGLVAVGGTAYLQSGRLEPIDLAAAIPVGTLVTAILVVNNLRDIETDRAAGKRTLAVQFGARFARAEYAGCLAVAWLVPVGLLIARAVAGSSSGAGPLILLPFVSLPMAAPLLRSVFSDGDPRRLNAVLRGTARLGLVFALLFTLGLAAG
jgi:1,4-dihydroxy-2-naphthoate polyprenyltransferase